MAEGQGRSSGQELKLLYLRDCFYKYTNSDNPKRMDAILKFLTANGIPASRVTVYNDIEILRNTLHIPIKYSAKHYGYYVEKPQFESHEMLMLTDAKMHQDVLRCRKMSASCTNTLEDASGKKIKYACANVCHSSRLETGV